MMTLPKSTEQSIAQTSSALGISTATNPALPFQKCVHYWPETEGTYGPFTIRVQGVSEGLEYIVRDLSIQVRSSSILGSEEEPSGVQQCPPHPWAR